MIFSATQIDGVMTECPEITLRIERPTPLVRYVFEFLFTTLGFRARETHEGPSDVFYGTRADPAAAVSIIAGRPGGAPRVAHHLSQNHASDGVVPYDLVHWMSELMTDEVNRKVRAGGKDEHGRLRFHASFQPEAGDEAVPLLNTYVEYMRRCLQRRLGATGVPYWPPGKRAAIGLSHDVDRIDRWAPVLAPVVLPGMGGPRNIRTQASRARSLLRNLRHPHDDFEAFRKVMLLEQRHGLRSTFFFASANRYSNGSSEHDVAYDIETPRICGLMKELRTNGFDIGLHASYNAWSDPTRMRAERDRLSMVLRSEVRGVRHHLWHLGEPIDDTLLSHEKAGLSYDSSMAFNDRCGYRRNIAIPFYPWHRGLGRKIHVMQLPVMCMDAALLSSHVSLEAAAGVLDSACQTLTSLDGLGVIDWHSDTACSSTPGYELWGRTFEIFLERVIDRREIWVTSLSEIYNWVRAREAALSPVFRNETISI